MTESQNGTTDPKARRGGGFPTLPLPDAVAGIITAGANGPIHTRDAFAAYLGHKTANSGAYKMKLAAMRDWGLIKRGDPDWVELTPLAVDIALAASEDRTDVALIKKAFNSCAAFAVMYESTAKNVPLTPSRIRTTAMMQYKVTADQADKFVDVFAKSTIYTGLAVEDGEAIKLLTRPADNGDRAGVDDLDDADADEVVQPSNVARMTSVSSLSGASTAVSGVRPLPAVVHQKYPTISGEVELVIRSSTPLEPDAYAAIGKVVAEVNALVEKLGPVPPTGTTDTEADES